VQALSLIVTALAVSLDGLGVGAAYGLARVRVPPVALGLVAAASTAAVAAGGLTGRLTGARLGPVAARFLGGLALMGLGAALFRRSRREAASRDGPLAGAAGGREPAPAGEKSAGSRVARIVRVLREPRTADVDRSGSLDAGEAFLLGLALAVDALAAGLALGLAGLWSAWLPPAVGLAQSGLLLTGLWLGARLGTRLEWRWPARRLQALPAGLLFVLGLARLAG